MQFATTFLSIINAAGMLSLESWGLGEVFIEYLMRSMRAKLDWVPYHRKIRQRKLRQNVNFNTLELKLPGLSNALGHYMKKQFEFDSFSLQILSTNLMLASQKSIDQVEEKDKSSSSHHTSKQNDLNNHLFEFIPNMKFGFCLTTVNAHSFLHMMDQIRYFNTERQTVGVIFDMKDKYWHKMIKNSRLDNLLPRNST